MLFRSSVAPLDYSRFLLEILNRWITLDDESVKITEIESIIKAFLGQEVRNCMFMGECNKYFTIYPNGAVYGCDSLPQIEKFYFGNVMSGLDAIFTTDNFHNFCRINQNIRKKCQKCKWFFICHGGCLQDYYPSYLDMGSKNLFCPGLQEIYKEIEKILKKYNLIN